MSTQIKTKTGKKIVLLNPAEKAKRYARQMKKGQVTETGKKLTKADIAYRAGYLDARLDNSKAYKALPESVRKDLEATSKYGKIVFSKKVEKIKK